MHFAPPIYCNRDTAKSIEEYQQVYKALIHTITQGDIRAIKKHWQDLAQVWWKSQEGNRVECVMCNGMLYRDQGYQYRKQVYCGNCINDILQDALSNLQDYPHFYGNNLLRKARGAL